MSKNPELILKFINIRKTNNPQTISRYSNIFENWSLIPGTGPDKSINYEFLEKWHYECLELIEKDDEIIYYSILGKLLSKSSEDDRMWPKKEVCKFIDEINNINLNKSFKNSIMNKYATYAKSLYDGGRREKSISNKYKEYAERIVDDYPITAKILFKVSKKFENKAKIEKFKLDHLDYEYD